MTHPCRSFLAATCPPLLLALALGAPNPGLASEQANPLRLPLDENGSFLQASAGFDLAVLSQGNAWFGNDKGVLDGQSVDSWWESLVRLGLEGSLALAGNQTLFAKVDAVQANTFGGVDVGGTNAVHGDVSSLRLDKLYAGWRSGDLFETLGKDFLDISFGRQIYTVGNGFLFNSQGEGGYKRAAWYIGGRKSADWSGIVRMRSGPWSGDLFLFEADRINDFEAQHFRDYNTRAGGATVNYAFSDDARLGSSVFAVDSDQAIRDGMRVYDIRGAVKPFARIDGPAWLRPLNLEFEYAHEDKDGPFADGNGWYAAASYRFAALPWQPELTYRYASFDEHYDPLFYGGTDWGTWFQGEIVGEYALSNNNLNTHMLRLKLLPVESLTVNLIYFTFIFHKPEAYGVESDTFGNEWNLIFDWAATDHLNLSLVGAYATPDEGAEQFLGGNKDWTSLMLYGCLRF